MLPDDSTPQSPESESSSDAAEKRKQREYVKRLQREFRAESRLIRIRAREERGDRLLVARAERLERERAERIRQRRLERKLRQEKKAQRLKEEAAAKVHRAMKMARIKADNQAADRQEAILEAALTWGEEDTDISGVFQEVEEACHEEDYVEQAGERFVERFESVQIEDIKVQRPKIETPKPIAAGEDGSPQPFTRQSQPKPPGHIVFSARGMPWRDYLTGEDNFFRDSWVMGRSWGLNPRWTKNQVDEIRRQTAMQVPRRALAVIFDSEMLHVPTVELQWEMICEYVRSHMSLVKWDGECDTYIQVLNINSPRRLASNLKFLRKSLHHTIDHHHVIIPSISFTTERSEYAFLPMIAAQCGKTMAILDHSIDTLKHPEQLMVMSSVRSGVRQSTYQPSPQRLYKQRIKMVPIGWQVQIVNGERTVTPDLVVRKACDKLAKMIDDWDGKDYRPPLHLSYDPARVRRMFSRLGLVPPHGKISVGLRYIASKLRFDPRLDPTIGRAIMITTGQDPGTSGSEGFDADTVVSKLDELFGRTRDHREIFGIRTAISETVRLWDSVTTTYEPGTFEPWIVDAMNRVPVRKMPNFDEIHEDFQPEKLKKIIKIMQESGGIEFLNNMLSGRLLAMLIELSGKRKISNLGIDQRISQENAIYRHVTRQDLMMSLAQKRQYKRLRRSVRKPVDEAPERNDSAPAAGTEPTHNERPDQGV